MNRISRWAAASAAALALAGGAATALPASAAPARPDITATCVACIHVQNTYAFRGALDAVHQATAVNSPISLWYETPTTTDAGADLLVVDAGVVTRAIANADFGVVNQSKINWVDYVGDSVVRFKYDPFGNGGANTYIGLNGQKGDGTSVALRKDNPNSVWQEYIEVPVNALGQPNGNNANGGINNLGGVPQACGSPVNPTPSTVRHCVLIDVGQTTNPNDPFILSDPNDAFTGSLVQQDVEQATINQFDAVATSQVWQFRN
jgi:hypothetical protein